MSVFRSSLLLCLAPICLALMLAAPAARASCDLKVVSAYPCDTNGNKVTPKVGDTYYVRFNWSVTGTPAQSYSVKFTEANQTYLWTGIQPGTGTFWGYVGWQLPLGGSIPYTVTLDPDNVTGDTNHGNNLLKGKFTPTPPTAAIQYYAPQTWNGAETFSVTWNPGSGTVTNGLVWQGVPTTGTFQKVLSATKPAGAKTVTTQPNSQPVWELDWSNYAPTSSDYTWNVTQAFKVQVSSVKVNPSKLGAVTWGQIAALPSAYTQWEQPDPLVGAATPL